MKSVFAIGLALLFNFAIGQQYEQFSNSEKEQIQSSSNEIMRVYNLAHGSDSVVLKSISKPIIPNHPLTQLLAKRMLLTVNDPLNKGVGIAAPQVGINRRLILVQRFDKPDKPFDVMVNPKIIWKSNLMQNGPEGDLSFDERKLITRHYAIQIQYENLEGKIVTEILEGFTAVIFQHERDHLDGILLTNRFQEQETESFSSTIYYLKE